MNPLLLSIKALFNSYGVAFDPRNSIYAKKFGDNFIPFMEELLTLIADRNIPDESFYIKSNLLVAHIPDALRDEIRTTRYFNLNVSSDDVSIACFTHSGAISHFHIRSNVFLPDSTFTVGQVVRGSLEKTYIVKRDSSFMQISEEFERKEGRVPNAAAFLDFAIEQGYFERIKLAQVVLLRLHGGDGAELVTENGHVANKHREYKQDGKWGR